MLFSITQPNFDIVVFQKMLLNTIEQNIPAILIISKIDLVSIDTLNDFLDYLEQNFGNIFKVFPISTESNAGIDELKKYIKGKSIILSGPSGVGKSTLINSLLGDEVLTTNEVSTKTTRGRHTTTESRFFKLDINSESDTTNNNDKFCSEDLSNTYVVDTPGFSSLDFPNLKEKKELEALFPDFIDYISECKFRDCIHTNEPNCNIKNNVNLGNISELRYKFYLFALDNIFNKNY